MAVQAAALAQDLNNKQQREAEGLAAERAVFANWELHTEEPIQIMDAFEE